MDFEEIFVGSVSQDADLEPEYGGDENVAASLDASSTSFRIAI
jgi:hypothetical protein